MDGAPPALALHHARGAPSADFVAFCAQHAQILSMEEGQFVPFRLYPFQREIAEKLMAGKWLWILKARQLGLTWLLAAYAVWLVLHAPNQKVLVLSKDRDAAAIFLERAKQILARLPEGSSCKPRVNNEQRLVLSDDDGGGEIQSLAAGKSAIRSLVANLVILDEAAFNPRLDEHLRAAPPAVEHSRGQVVGISTSDGPRGRFHEVWHAAHEARTPFEPVFIPWHRHPSRDAAWYARQNEMHAADPVFMKREYPATPEEAFEGAEGRVYPLFARDGRFLREMNLRPEWPRYRALDFGGRDPFVCLWGCLLPGEGSALTIDPSCVNLIRELLAYSYDGQGLPADNHNHACDALRYMAVTAGGGGITGRLHVYRELYEPDSAARGFSCVDMAERVRARSGNERFACTVADRSRPDLIALFDSLGMPATGQRALSGARLSEIEQGIARVNALLTGTAKGPAAAPLPQRTPPALPENYRPAPPAWRFPIFA